MIKINFRDTIQSYDIQMHDPFMNIIINLLETCSISLDDLGLNKKDFAEKAKEQSIKIIIGEYLAKLGSASNLLASHFLGDAQWNYGNNDWFDHRHHLLDPKERFSNDWIASGFNVLKVLPIKGVLLDLCSGDGFYAYYLYRTRASHIDCIEKNPELINHSKRLHSANNIKYISGDILNYNFKTNFYDVIVIRGAIEHFSAENQQKIFQKVNKALKPAGWFCGDTPANPQKKQHKMLPAHENEWVDEREMETDLKKVFDIVITDSFKSPDRTTLIFRCKKK